MLRVSLLFFVFQFVCLYSYSQNYSYTTFNSKLKKDSVIDIKNIDTKLISSGVLYYTNIYRKSKRKKKLLYSLKLEKAASIHSSEMEKHNFFDHTNRKNRKFRNLDDRIDYVGYSTFLEIAENIYYGFVNLNDIETYSEISNTITEAFIASRTHKLNLLDKGLKEIGMKIVFTKDADEQFLYYYFTQNFGTLYKP